MTEQTAEFLPIRKAAQALNVSHVSLYNLITAGKLSWAWKENGNRMAKMIRVSDAAGLVRPTRGRPPVVKGTAANA